MQLFIEPSAENRQAVHWEANRIEASRLGLHVLWPRLHRFDASAMRVIIQRLKAVGDGRQHRWFNLASWRNMAKPSLTDLTKTPLPSQGSLVLARTAGSPPALRL